MGSDLGAPHGPVVDRSIGYAVQFSNSSHSRDSPHTLACGPDASESASKSECPRILYQVSFYVEDALSVDAVSRGRAPAGEPERTPGTTRAPGGTRRGTIHGTACCLSCLITHVDGAARSTVNVSRLLSTHSYLAFNPSCKVHSAQKISNRPAAPMPPPTHMVTTADLAPRLLPSRSTWPTCREPAIPISGNPWQSVTISGQSVAISGPPAESPSSQSVAIRGNPWQSVAISDPPAESPSCQTGGQSRWRRR